MGYKDENYTREALIDWFHRTFGVTNIQGSELQTQCPTCGYENFYFNLKKRVGICHKARCNFCPSLGTLISRAGFGPDASGIRLPIRSEHATPRIPAGALEMPGVPVAYRENRTDWYTNHQESYDYLLSRGITNEQMVKHSITTDGVRVYIPIYAESGDLVNFVSRLLSGGNPEWKYLYAKGRSTSNYIFGWNEAKLWDKCVLVENTFVSIALRHLFCTTVFGSALSKQQATLIAAGRAKSVILLWDEGAYKKCDKAITLLGSLGVKAACYHPMIGQPDDYPLEEIELMINGVHEAALKGERTWHKN